MPSSSTRRLRPKARATVGEDRLPGERAPHGVVQLLPARRVGGEEDERVLEQPGRAAARKREELNLPPQRRRARRPDRAASTAPSRSTPPASAATPAASPRSVVAHLTGLVGAQVRITLEIEADLPGGAPEHVVRTVTENSRTLEFTSQGFERE